VTDTDPQLATEIAPVTFDTKVAIVVREDLAVWQKLNVTAFLMSGIVSEHPEIIGEPYEDADGGRYSRLSRQPVIVLKATAEKLGTIRNRAMGRGITFAIYTEEMFSTGHDDANRAAVRGVHQDDMRMAGMALRAERKIVDKICKGAKMHD
jgi:hypothetical protein